MALAVVRPQLMEARVVVENLTALSLEVSASQVLAMTGMTEQARPMGVAVVVLVVRPQQQSQA
jgi:hypothetical protein